MDEQNLQLAWRLSVGGQGLKTNAKLLSRRSIDVFNVPKTCVLIEERASSIPLQKSSGLLYGTVLVYKRKCEFGFRETQSVKWSIQRIKDAFLTLKSKDTNNKSNKINGKVKLLHDDPKFDVDLLGLNNNHIDLNSLLKDLDSNQSSSIGLGMGDMSNWRSDHGLREMSVSTENSDWASIDYIPFDERKVVDNDSNVEPAEQEKNIWGQELDFGFDPDGNTIDINGNTMKSQAPIDDVIEEHIEFNAFDNDETHNFEFDSFDNGIEVESESTPEPTIKSKRKLGQKVTQSIKRRKVIYDEDIYLSISVMKERRDKFICNEFTRRLQWHSKKTRPFVLQLDPRVTFISLHTGLLPTPKPTGHRNSDIPDFELYDNEIEAGRRRRSSSVSSIEIARRAVDSKGVRGNSSSLQFDFNIETSQNHGQFNLSADEVHLDIDLDETENESFIDPSANMDSFMEGLETKFKDLATNKVELGILYPHVSTSKKDAARSFHMILHCATKGKLDLSVSRNAIGKSQWEVLTSEDIMIGVK